MRQGQAPALQQTAQVTTLLSSRNIFAHLQGDAALMYEQI